MNDFYMSEIKANGHIHFIGIGGISMSGLAHICIDRGYNVSGSDMNESHITRLLESIGAKIYKGHGADNVSGADLVVYTAAINPANPELMEANKRGIKAIERSVFLGALMRDYGCSICVAGTHGKTTTTSMMSHVLLACELDPTIMIGGELDKIGGNMRVGGDKYFLTEACEYHRSFLEFFPNVSIITNVEADHLDYFKDLDDIKDAFRNFAEIAGENGYVVVCGDDKDALECTDTTKSQILTYGMDDSNIFCPKNLVYNDGCGEFDAEFDGSLIHVRLNVPGSHNVLNALACFATGYALSLDGEKIAAGLEEFTLVHRRFEKKGEAGGAMIIDDYAHHPTEINCTLKTAKQMCKGKVYVVFQPHTYTRTKLLIDEFETAFDSADEIIVTDIYAAREKDTGLIHARDLAERLKKHGKSVRYISEFEDIAAMAKDTLTEGDIFITMGAGSVYKIGDMILKK